LRYGVGFCAWRPRRKTAMLAAAKPAAQILEIVTLQGRSMHPLADQSCGKK